MTTWYVLDENNEPQKIGDLPTYLEWLQANLPNHPYEAGTPLWSDTIENILISTVFLNMDHNPGVPGDPVLFETMILMDDPDHPLNGKRNRYRTYKEAQAGHEHALQLVTTYLTNSILHAPE